MTLPPTTMRSGIQRVGQRKHAAGQRLAGAAGDLDRQRILAARGLCHQRRVDRFDVVAGHAEHVRRCAGGDTQPGHTRDAGA
jgi:hypothetical protein